MCPRWCPGSRGTVLLGLLVLSEGVLLRGRWVYQLLFLGQSWAQWWALSGQGAEAQGGHGTCPVSRACLSSGFCPPGAGVTYSANLAAVSRAWCTSRGVDVAVARPSRHSRAQVGSASLPAVRSRLERCVGFWGECCREGLSWHQAWAAEWEGGSLGPRVPFWEGLPRIHIQKQSCLRSSACLGPSLVKGPLSMLDSGSLLRVCLVHVAGAVCVPWVVPGGRPSAQQWCGLSDGLPGGAPRTLERWASEQGQAGKVIRPVHVFMELDSTSCQSPLSSALLRAALR